MSITPPKVSQKAKNKENIDNIENLIKKNKNRFANHQQTMQEYNKRLGVPENTKIFQYNSQDDHIKRALLKLGWVENK